MWQWYRGEVLRGYMLHKARCLSQAAREAAVGAPPGWLVEREASGRAVPSVVLMAAADGAEGGEERQAVLLFAMGPMGPDLWRRLRAGLRVDGREGQQA